MNKLREKTKKTAGEKLELQLIALNRKLTDLGDNDHKLFIKNMRKNILEIIGEWCLEKSKLTSLVDKPVTQTPNLTGEQRTQIENILARNKRIGDNVIIAGNLLMEEVEKKTYGDTKLSFMEIHDIWFNILDKIPNLATKEHDDKIREEAVSKFIEKFMHWASKRDGFEIGEFAMFCDRYLKSLSGDTK